MSKDVEKMEQIRRLLDTRIGIERRRRTRRIEDAVNWDDLRVVDVEYVETLSGEAYYCALIEEASPTARVFQTAMLDQLRRNDMRDVQVRTEW
jgi:hypothetical protein